MALESKEQITEEQLALARRTWNDVGVRNAAHLRAQLEGVPEVRRELSRLRDRTSELSAASALQLHWLQAAAAPLRRAVAALDDALQTVTAERAGAAQQQADALSRLPGIRRRSRGAASRTVEFVRLMLEREPRLPRKTGWWLLLDDHLPVSPNASKSRQERREYWKKLLEREQNRERNGGRNRARVSDPESRST